jgi:polyisoprenoid-binding protein YceI
LNPSHTPKAVLCLAALAAGTAASAPAAAPSWQDLTLSPPATEVGFTTYALGMWPLPGHFTRFAGMVRVNRAHPAQCTVTLDVEAGSLIMADPDRTRTAMGPSLLDTAQFPRLHYSGTCGNGRSDGVLTLHGVTRAMTFHTHHEGDRVIAEGTLRRSDFGITGLPGMIGRTIRMTVTTTASTGLAALVAP